MLNASPFISYSPPYLETNRGSSCTFRPYFRERLYPFTIPHSNHDETNEEDESIMKDVTNTMVEGPRHEFVTQRVAGKIDEPLLAEYRARGARLLRLRLHKALGDKRIHAR